MTRHAGFDPNFGGSTDRMLGALIGVAIAVGVEDRSDDGRVFVEWLTDALETLTKRGAQGQGAESLVEPFPRSRQWSDATIMGCAAFATVAKTLGLPRLASQAWQRDGGDSSGWHESLADWVEATHRATYPYLDNRSIEQLVKLERELEQLGPDYGDDLLRSGGPIGGFLHFADHVMMVATAGAGMLNSLWWREPPCLVDEDLRQVLFSALGGYDPTARAFSQLDALALRGGLPPLVPHPSRPWIHFGGPLHAFAAYPSDAVVIGLGPLPRAVIDARSAARLEVPWIFDACSSPAVGLPDPQVAHEANDARRSPVLKEPQASAALRHVVDLIDRRTLGGETVVVLGDDTPYNLAGVWEAMIAYDRHEEFALPTDAAGYPRHVEVPDVLMTLYTLAPADHPGPPTARTTTITSPVVAEFYGKPIGAQVDSDDLNRALLRGNPPVTVAALSVMARNLGNGTDADTRFDEFLEQVDVVAEIYQQDRARVLADVQDLYAELRSRFPGGFDFGE